MQTSNIKVTIDMPIPVKVPDNNGVVYTRPAIREAARDIYDIPLKCGDVTIGKVDAAYICSEQEDKAVLRIFATIPCGGTNENIFWINEAENKICGCHITEVVLGEST